MDLPPGPSSSSPNLPRVEEPRSGGKKKQMKGPPRMTRAQEEGPPPGTSAGSPDKRQRSAPPSKKTSKDPSSKEQKLGLQPGAVNGGTMLCLCVSFVAFGIFFLLRLRSHDFNDYVAMKLTQ